MVCALLTTASQARQPAIEASAAAPAWLAWRVFHESLIYYADQSQEQTEDVLSTKFDLGRGDVRTLVTEGQGYIAAIAAIDAEARVEARARYALPDADRRSGANGARWVSKTKPGPTQSLRARAIEDGLFAQIEARKVGVLAAHTRSLARLIDRRGLSRVGMFVESAVAAEITTFDRGRRMPRTERQPMAVPGFAPWPEK